MPKCKVSIYSIVLCAFLRSSLSHTKEHLPKATNGVT